MLMLRVSYSDSSIFSMYVTLQALVTEFLGSNPSLGKMVFPFFFFFLLLLLYFLRHGSIQSVVGPVWSPFEMQHCMGSTSINGKKNLRDLFEKNPSSAICGAKNLDISAMFEAK